MIKSRLTTEEGGHRNALKERMFSIIDGHGSLEEFKRVLDQGANPEWKLNKKTALLAAIVAGRSDLVGELLFRKVRLHLPADLAEDTPIGAAILGSRLEILRKLLQQDPKLIAWDPGFYYSWGEMAANLGRAECLKVMVEAGLALDSKSFQGQTLLHIAVAKGHYSCVRYLLDFDVPLDVRDFMERTPLDLALVRDHIPMISMLLDKGCDPFAIDESGKDLLEKAKSEEAEALIEKARLRWSMNRVSRHAENEIEMESDREAEMGL